MLPGNVSNTFTPLNVSNKCIEAIPRTFPAIIAQIIACILYLKQLTTEMAHGMALRHFRSNKLPRFVTFHVANLGHQEKQRLEKESDQDSD
jgi:hypothetical protein